MACADPTRRQAMAGMAGAGLFSGPARAAAPAAAVAIARCRDYQPAVLVPALARMFDQLGGLERLVKNKTVAIKVNFTGSPTYRLGHRRLEHAHWTHPAVIAASAHLMSRAGARRIRILESPWSTAEPIEEYLLQAGLEPRDILRAAPRVEFENTNYLGRAKQYAILAVPGGGYLYDRFFVNHAYTDCDVFVSIPKLKLSPAAGITIAIKNSFGILPATIYGDGAGRDEPSVLPSGGRTMLHTGHRQPAGYRDKDPKAPPETGYRIPRVIVDLAAARPIDLTIVDGIEAMTHTGPWIPGAQPISPGVLVAGANCVNVDAVGTALMGCDPMADRGAFPFEKIDNPLRLAEERGLGTRDLRRIEVMGASIREAAVSYRQVFESRT